MADKIMYRTSSISRTIGKHLVVKTSDKSIWYKHSNLSDVRRELKVGSDHRWHETALSAVNHLLDGVNKKLDSLAAQEESARARKKHLLNMMSKIEAKAIKEN